MEGTGWRPVSQIAIDEVWSALRFRPIKDVQSRNRRTRLSFNTAPSGKTEPASKVRAGD
jgi:hypothetical protein